MHRITYNIRRFVYLTAILALPVLVSARAWPIVPDCDVKCGYADFIQLGKNIIDFLLVIAIPLAALSFAYAGFLYITAQGNPGKISEAHSIFWKVLVGFVLILAAWLIVELIVNTFLNDTVLEVSPVN